MAIVTNFVCNGYNECEKVDAVIFHSDCNTNVILFEMPIATIIQ